MNVLSCIIILYSHSVISHLTNRSTIPVIEILEIIANNILIKNSPRIFAKNRSRKFLNADLFGKNEFSPALGFCYLFPGFQGGGGLRRPSRKMETGSGERGRASI